MAPRSCLLNVLDAGWEIYVKDMLEEITPFHVWKILEAYPITPE